MWSAVYDNWNARREIKSDHYFDLDQEGRKDDKRLSES